MLTRGEAARRLNFRDKNDILNLPFVYMYVDSEVLGQLLLGAWFDPKLFCFFFLLFSFFYFSCSFSFFLTMVVALTVRTMGP